MTDLTDAGVALFIRRAREEDACALRRLAALDGAPPPAGAMLIAECHGHLVAAVPLGGGRAIADPFRATAGVVRLLELRAAQIEVRARQSMLRRLGRNVRLILARPEKPRRVVNP